MNKNLLYLGLFLLCLLLGYFFYSGNPVDDAFISLRYARNLADGYGLRFNPSDHNPVEAYTNFAWVLLQSPLFYLKLNVFTIITVLALLSLLGCFYAVCRTNRKQIPFMMLGLSGFHALYLWSFSGLETAFLAAVILLWNLAFFQQQYRKCAFYAFLALLLRPDSLLVFFVHAIFIIYRQKKPFPPELLSYSAILILLLLPYAIFKLWFFGNLLPNTFFAKTGLSLPILKRGLQYLAINLSWPEILILLGLVLYRLKTDPTPELKVSSSIFGFYCAYALSCGGDFLPMYRFIFPCVPLLLFTVLKDSKKPQISLLFPMGFIITTLLPGYPSVLKESQQAQTAINAANSLCTIHPPGTKAITAASGIINFFCDWEAIDLFGLTTPEIARRKMPPGKISAAGHDKYDIEYAMEQNPEIVVPFFWLDFDPGPIDIRKIDSLNPESESYQALSELFTNKLFLSRYRQAAIPLENVGQQSWFIYFTRKPKRPNKPELE